MMQFVLDETTGCDSDAMFSSMASFEKVPSALLFSVKPNDPKSVFSSGAGPDALDLRYHIIAINLLRAENNAFGTLHEVDKECGDIAHKEGDDETSTSEKTGMPAG